jgi:hypothetical protein
VGEVYVLPASPIFSLVSAGWRDNQATAATPIAIEAFPALPPAFFARPAQAVAPDLIGCLLVKRQEDWSLLWGVVMETEVYSQDAPATRSYRSCSPQNETLLCKLRTAWLSPSQH